MNVLPLSAINALDIAAKLATVRNRIHPPVADEFEADPRLREMAWYIQWASTEPGGLRQFVSNLMDAQAHLFITQAMRDNKPRSGAYSMDGLLEVWWSFPHRSTEDVTTDRIRDILNNIDSLNRRALARDGMDKVITSDLPPDLFMSICRKRAAEVLPAMLRQFCIQPDFSLCRGTIKDARTVGCGSSEREMPEDWWCCDLLGALMAMMESHTKAVAGRLSRTSVVARVWDALDYAWHTRGFVTIEGNTRFGKTEAVRSWCEMYPWRARYLAAPHSSSEKELLTEVAAAFRLPYSWSTPEAQLREEIGFLLQFGGIGLIIDEGQFLLPTRYNKGTSPHRLNWFRTQLADRRVPCALCYTSQFTKDLERYTKSTGYVVDQWLGRPKLRVKLNDALPDGDTLAVAQKHLSWCSEGLRMQIAGRAKASNSFLKAIEDVADRARWIATRDGRKCPTEADAERAMLETLPAMESLLTSAVTPAHAQPSPPSGEQPAKPRRMTQKRAVTPGDDGENTLPKSRVDRASLELISTG